MSQRTRRMFLSDVGQGMLVAGLGSALAGELGITSAAAAERSENALTFGDMEPLVALMQQTPIEKLQPLLVEKLQGGTDLRTLTAAGALANARTFGGEDYVGFHTIMALLPAYQMSQQMPSEGRALPVLKVLYRNTDRIHGFGGKPNEVLEHIEHENAPAPENAVKAMRDSARRVDYDGAEQTFAKLVDRDAEGAYNALQHLVQDEINVHRIVLAWRAWDMLGLLGAQHAHTMLRQSLRFCVKSEEHRKRTDYPVPTIREQLPRLLDEHRLLSRQPKPRQADDAWIDELGRTIFASGREQAAETVAAALAEGFSPEDIGEALSLAANQLVLHDPGRSKAWDGKPIGSVHGDSVGVHASDAANAWRNVAKVSNRRNIVAGMIVGAYHTAGQAPRVSQQPYPYAEQLESISSSDADALLGQLDEAVRAKEQAQASAIVDRYSRLGQSAEPVFNLLLKFAVSEDGALHAEKYYHTVREEFHRSRPAFRWRHLIALARVTSSEYGYAAPGREQALALLKV